MKTIPKPIYKNYEFDALVANLQMKDERYEDMFRLDKDDDYTLYELKQNPDLYIEEVTIGTWDSIKYSNRKMYLVHDNKTAKSFPRGDFYETFEEAKATCILLNEK